LQSHEQQTLATVITAAAAEFFAEQSRASKHVCDWEFPWTVVEHHQQQKQHPIHGSASDKEVVVKTMLPKFLPLTQSQQLCQLQ